MNTPRQRVAIIGAGSAGLLTAWLLHGHHDVVVFERAERPGGHIHTVQAPIDGGHLPVEMGAEFFFEDGYTGLTSLIDRFGLSRVTRKLSVSMTLDGGRTTFAVPPRTAAGVWSCLPPRTIRRLLWLRALAAGAEAVADAGDWSLTVRGLTEQVGMPRDVADALAIPLVAASWGTTREGAAELSAYCVVRVMGLRLKHTAHSIIVDGGLLRYIEALIADMPRVELRLGARVGAMALRDDGLIVGAGERFDAVVLACDWHNSAALCGGDSRLDPWHRAFAACEDYTVRVALHRDPQVMPARRSRWGNANFMLGAEGHPRNTVWSGAHGRVDLFRTWLRPDEDPPPSTMHLAGYRHISMTPAHRARQARLAELQGTAGIWAAGMYTAGVDNHESALRSALRVAERLAPEAERVRWFAERVSD